MKRLLIFLLIPGALKVFSQDITGAYISSSRVTNSANTYSITVTLFTEGTLNISRPTVTLSFGDASTGTFSAVGVSGNAGTNIKTYTGTHQYNGAGNYLVSLLDTFRVANIKNMQNSQVQPVYVGSQINITNFSMQNSSPSILNFPGNFGSAGTQVFYNPACYDPDSDSLSYVLTQCSGAGYYLPANTSISNSGLFSFYPDSVGLYCFSFTVKEWRKNTSGMYVTIGSTQFDFLIGITTSIGLNEITKTSEFVIYPNPVTSELKITCDGIIAEDQVIQISNNLGQIVLKTSCNQKTDLSFLPEGIYVLRISEKYQSSQSFKIIKN